MKNVAILGSTGTIGVNTLEVISCSQGRFEVIALTAHQNVDKLLEQCLVWRPQYAAMSDLKAAEILSASLKAKGVETEVFGGPDAQEKIASLDEVHQVMAGIVGSAGLMSTLAAARSGKRVLLANKEVLVMSGHLMMAAVRENGGELLPIDSEHNAIFQCLPSSYTVGEALDNIRRILLTGSGGPFRGLDWVELDAITPEQACSHPNWVMGPKISVDSATLMNKGLEMIEACWLFDAKPSQIEVIIHPQSIIHSMVEYLDGSVLAQLSYPDMRIPIAHALAWPKRIDTGSNPLDFTALKSLEFESLDLSRAPCLRLAFAAAEVGGSAPVALNAANEVAVKAFLDRRIRFTEIPKINESILEQHNSRELLDIDTILTVDREVRQLAAREVESVSRERV